MNIQHEFSPKIVPLKVSKQRLTSAAGLGTLIEAFDNSPLKVAFSECLPERSSPRSKGAYRLALIQLASFLYGHDCLDDLSKFRQDPYLTEIMDGETAAPKTMGDFLRDFTPENSNSLNLFLSKQAKAYRLQLFKMLKKEFKPKLAPHMSEYSLSPDGEHA